MTTRKRGVRRAEKSTAGDDDDDDDASLCGGDPERRRLRVFERIIRDRAFLRPARRFCYDAAIGSTV